MTTEATLRDLERTAALLEGRLAGAERDAAIARVEADEDLREVLADLIRFRAAGAADTAPALAPRPAWHRRARRLVLPFAAAAAIAVVVLLPGRDGQLPAGWYEHAWDVTRGSSARSPGTGTDSCDGRDSPDTGNASFRLGIRLQELSTAIAAGDSAGAAIVGCRLSVSVGRLGGMELAVVEVRDLGQGSAGARNLLPRLAAIDRAIGSHRAVDPSAFALGKWAAAGRLAAMAGDADAVPPASPELREQAQRLSRGDADRTLAFAQLQDALASDDGVARGSKLAKAFDDWIDRF